MATHPRAAVESLDPADAPAVDVIDWYVVKPERFSGWEIVQSNINAGVRCPLVDIVRLKSTFFDTMVDECEKRREKRILIPNGTFATPAELHAAVGWQFPSQIIIFPEGSIKSIILAYHKLDILKNIHGRAFLEEMGNKKEAMTPPERMNTGHVCHLPPMVKQGVFEFASQWTEGKPTEPVLAHMATLLSIAKTTVEIRDHLRQSGSTVDPATAKKWLADLEK
jgi:hypothetical protein